MADDRGGGPGPVTHTRQVTIDALCEHFANDLMSVDEFERRIDAAHQASTNDQLKELLRDLPGGDVPAVVEKAAVPAPAPRNPVTAAANVKDHGFVVAVMGGAGRKGRWTPARKNHSIAIFGGAELDFRDAIMPPGVTELQIFTVCGGVEVIVPPGMNVESHGFALMGGFDHAADNYERPDADAPTLRITGFALMAGVDVTVRHPGETARDARRRRKLEKKERRRLAKGG